MTAAAYAEVLGRPMGAVVAVVLGLLWGSFANVCIYRWPPSDEFPNGRSVVLPPSHCFVCKTPIRWYDNVPLLSYLWLRGGCRACKARFSARYLIVEALTGVLFGVAWWVWLAAPARDLVLSEQLAGFVVSCVFVFAMVVITFIDLDHQLILDKITLPSIPLLYGASLLLPGQTARHWSEGLIGAGLGFGVLWLIGEVYYRVTGRDGLGIGDAKLLAMVGALLGWRGVVVAVGVGSVLASVIGIAAIVLSRQATPTADAADARSAAPATAPASAPATDAATAAEPAPASPPSLRHTAIPLGPFLATGATVYLFCEPWLRANVALLAL